MSGACKVALERQNWTKLIQQHGFKKPNNWEQRGNQQGSQNPINLGFPPQQQQQQQQQQPAFLSGQQPVVPQPMGGPPPNGASGGQVNTVSGPGSYQDFNPYQSFE